ncbi:MAG TPA: hypothetical protein ENN81_12940 [Phycisphaerales bacterium]|nr:hypothetical protein [Phycisphaerales bacterium]
MGKFRSGSGTKAVALAIVLVGAAGLGYGIWRVHAARASLKKPPEPAPRVAVDIEPVAPVQPVVEAPEPAFPPLQEPPAVPEYVEPPAIEPQRSLADVAGGPPMGGGFGQGFGGNDGQIFQRVFGDIKLTPEEEDRFRQGMSQAIQRFWTMSEGDRQAEMERLRSMGERWQGMNESDREAAMQRVRARFDEWRTSGGTELPPLSLD